MGTLSRPSTVKHGTPGSCAWLNKNSPVKATGAQISIIGHITRDELLMELSNNDKVNGFGNRNLWLCVQRSKFLPDGGDWDHLDLEPLISRLKDVVEFTREVGEMRRNAEAGAMWYEVYPQLSGERGGLFGLTYFARPRRTCSGCPASTPCSTSQQRSGRCHLERRWLCGSTVRTRRRSFSAPLWKTKSQTRF